MHSSIRAGILGVFLVVLSATAAFAGPLNTLTGIARQYNVYTIGNIGSSEAGQAYSSDSQASVAAGGDAYFKGFGAYSDLVIGGDLDYRNGQVWGDSSVGGTATLAEGGNVLGILSDGLGAGVSPYSGMPFADVSADILEASRILAGFAATGTASNSFGSLSLDGDNNVLNVFSLAADDIRGATSFEIAAPSSSTVLVNVLGESLAASNFGFFLNGIAAENVIFNFSDAKSLNFAGLGWQGSVLAPNASVLAKWGSFDGSMIAGELTGLTYQNAEYHDARFSGELPTATSTTNIPLPATLVLMLAGLCCLGAFCCIRAPSGSSREPREPRYP